MFYFFENCAVYEIMWKNMVQPDRPQMTIWCMRIVCWITKATDTLLEYVMLIPFHYKRVSERASCYVIRSLPASFIVFCKCRGVP
jgi:hypothetical protein